MLALLLGSTQAQALPISRAAPAQLPASFTAAYDFEGIVRLSNCSGALVRLENAKDPDAALVLTNGHCLETGFAQPGGFTFRKPSTRSFTLMNRDASNAGTVHAAQILYSTMTKTDMTIYQLHETYAEILASSNVRPLTLASKHPEAGVRVDVLSGYWSRGYSCNIDRFVPTLKEDSYVWSDSQLYSQPGCETIHGTSGSPVIQTGTRTVVGVNNTGNDDGEECTMDNPCEVDENGKISAVKGRSYAQETYWVYSCLNAGGELDITQKGCALPH